MEHEDNNGVDVPSKMLKNARMEKWLPIPGYEYGYEVSDKGRVKSLARTLVCTGPIRKRPNGKRVKERILKQENIKGYLVVGLKERHKLVKKFLVHRLVLLAFIGPSDLTVNHKDFNRMNNCFENLEYMSRLENQRHLIASGRPRNVPMGDKSPNTKITAKQRIEIKKLKGSATQAEIAKRYGVTHQLISLILRS